MIRFFLLLETASFAVAGSIHSGVLVGGYEHRAASIAESTIALVLLCAGGLTRGLPTRTRLLGIIAQAFAFVGTLIGAFTIAIGIGPRTVPDIVFHLTILAVLG